MSGGKISYSALSDEALASLARGGDEPAFNELVLRYIGRLGFIARKYSARGYEHTDFLQEGLIGLLYAARSWRADSGRSFGSYAMLVAERRFISIIRRQSALSAVPSSALVALDALDGEIVDTALTPEEQLLLRDRRERIRRCLEQTLSARELAVFSLYQEGLRYSEIAGRLGISVKAVDNALQRVRKKLGGFDMS